MAGIINLSEENFEREVIQSELPVLVDFWAPWCGPCRMVGPIVEILAVENKGKINITKLNVDENPDLAGKFGVKGIPTLAFFKGGAEVKRVVGAMGKAQLQQAIDEVVNVL